MDKYWDFYRKNDFINTRITSIGVGDWGEGNDKLYSIRIHGDFVNNTYRHYDLVFSGIRIKNFRCKGDYPETFLNKLEMMNGTVITGLSVDNKLKKFYVKLELAAEKRIFNISFQCETFWAYGVHYRGMDYTNVYGTPEYLKWAEDRSYVFDEKYFFGENVAELPDGYSLSVRNYLHRTEHADLSYGSKCEFRKDGNCIYSYTTYDHHHHSYKDFIFHSNGHRYYPFHIDLYGISFIDVDTLDVFNYIPRGYDNDYGLPAGESFIVVSVNYNKETDLIAYEGCYWAGPYDVMVGKLNDPLNFDPHLISVSEYFDRKHEELPEIDFASWDEDGLTVKYETDDGVEEKIVAFDVLKKEMGKQNKQRLD